VDISVTVCVFLLVCTVTDFSAEDKASGVKYGTAVHWCPRQGISQFCVLCFPISSPSPTSPKSDECQQMAQILYLLTYFLTYLTYLYIYFLAYFTAATIVYDDVAMSGLLGECDDAETLLRQCQVSSVQ